MGLHPDFQAPPKAIGLNVGLGLIVAPLGGVTTGIGMLPGADAAKRRRRARSEVHGHAEEAPERSEIHGRIDEARGGDDVCRLRADRGTRK